MTEEILKILDPHQAKCCGCERWSEKGQWKTKDIRSPEKGKVFWCEDCLKHVEEIFKNKKVNSSKGE